MSTDKDVGPLGVSPSDIDPSDVSHRDHSSSNHSRSEQGRSAEASQPPAHVATFARRIAGQSALLLAGFASAQGASFLRNALIGRYLSPADFGIAASVTLALQLMEILSDLGADRLIVQARDGDSASMMANIHAALVFRGVMAATLIFVAAAPLTIFLRIEPALWAFQTIALVPLLKGFMHIDYRRAQRHLDNRPYLMVDSATQIAAALMAVPVVIMTASYAAIVWIMLIQAVLGVAVSHLIATRRYELGFERAIVHRIISFGCPIWLSAFPLIAVYQGERILVGRMFGMSELAAYSAAFMITMVPSLIVAKLGQAVMLPLLAAVQDRANEFARRFQLMCEISAAVAAGYLILFVIAGGWLLPLAFGANYAGLNALVGCLALMWAARMVQAVPGMALMARGDTKPLLIAGVIRALALFPAMLAAWHGAGLAAIALAGLLGETASAGYLAWKLSQINRRLARYFLLPSALLLPAAAIGFASSQLAGAQSSPAAIIIAGMGLAVLATAAVIAVTPATRAAVRNLWPRPAGRAIRPQ